MPRHRRSSARGSVPERSLSDPILLELVKNALDTIVDEMAIALVRTAYSNNLKNAMDMSCALCDAEGRLIAQGLTDAQVAERLVVSAHTVHAHLRSIYGKLDVTSRAAATRFAVDYHLV